jgi:hypothetical protein
LANKFGKLLLAYVITMGILINLSSSIYASSLSDINNHWAKSAIEQAIIKGYVKGDPKGNFKPDNKVTRAEFIKMLVAALGLSTEEAKGSWYRPYVETAVTMNLYMESDSKDYLGSISRLEIMRLTARGLAMKAPYAAYLDAFKGLYNGDIPMVDYKEL